MTNLCVTIMAGGLGKRMLSDIPKVLHTINGVPMIVRIINTVLMLEPKKILIVVGKNKDAVKKVVSEQVKFSNIVYVFQEEPLGTGHAIKCSLEHFTSDEDDNMMNLILCGDTPLLTSETLTILYKSIHNASIQLTAIQVNDPTGYGRVIVHKNGYRIIEENDCSDEQKEVDIVNCSIYFVKVGLLKTYIPMIRNDNKKSEFYLTDIIELAGNEVSVFILDKSKQNEIYNVNSPEQLSFVENILIQESLQN